MLRPDLQFEVHSSVQGTDHFGMAGLDSGFIIVDVFRGRAKVETLSTQVGLARLATKLSRGFVRQVGRPYFDEATSTFVRVHPELRMGVHKWLIAAMPNDIPEGVDLVKHKLLALPASVVFPEEIDLWVQRNKGNSNYLLAFDDHCVFALATAQTALEIGWPMRNSDLVKGFPDEPPSMAPIAWATWLSDRFEVADITSAQRALGWTMESIIAGKVHPDVGDNLAALF